jgi:hypothetical protein
MLIKEKIAQAVELLKEFNLDVWLTGRARSTATPSCRSSPRAR